MNTAKNIHELLDVDVKNALIKRFESSFGIEKLDIVSERNGLHRLSFKVNVFLKDKIEKSNGDKAAGE